jgi:hypothetical protein
MPKIVEPRFEFTSLSEEEVLKALADVDPSNPIAVEVARLLTGYSENFAEHCARIGRMPEQVLHATPRSPIEAVAMRLMGDTVKEELGRVR